MDTQFNYTGPLPTPATIEEIEAENDYADRFLPPAAKTIRTRICDRSFHIAEFYHDEYMGSGGDWDYPIKPDFETRILEREQEADRAEFKAFLNQTIGFYVARGWVNEPIVKACRIALRWS